ncbi:MAG TPA: hypothetical protein DCQ31_16860 [Bacteroidales bacterium]|nr:hypothetical protein [Bacteroidales bacterium]
MKLIFSYLLLVQNFIIFVVSVLVLYPLSFIVKVEKLEPLVRRLFRFILKANFIKSEVFGIEQLDPAKSYLIIPNHQSFFDAILLTASFPNYIRGMEVSDHFDWPVYGKFIKRFGNIPIDQTSVKSSMESFKVAKNYLLIGKSVVVFPEGQRTLDGEIGQFKRLPFLFAKDAQVEIVPVAIKGLYEIMPPGCTKITPGKAQLIIGKPISYEEYKNIDTKLLTEKVRNIIIDMVHKTNTICAN